MRLLFSATVIVVGFFAGAWGIAHLVPESPVWFKLALAVGWLLALIFGGFVGGSGEGVRKRDDQRRLFGYGLLTAVLSALFLVPIFTYKINVPKGAAEAILLAIA